MSESRILIIDQDAARAETISAIFRFMDCTPSVVADAAELKQVERSKQEWLAIVLGTVEPLESMVQFAEWLKRDRYHAPLLLLPEISESMQQSLGFDPAACFPVDYPFKHSQVQELIRRSHLQRKSTHEPAAKSSNGLTGTSPTVRRLRRMIEQVSAFDTTVLITGESGTGKEVVARTVHETSGRRDKPFVAVNCGAIPSELLESELFGHEKGAFTGAITARKGRFEMADGGTLFLDEIGDMSLPMQVKILRALQERTYERVGSNRSVRCDVRIIAATHRDLEDNISKGSFREDLFYRLNVFPIEMPPLRDRIEDLSLLIDDITRNLEQSGHGSVRLAPDAVSALRLYAWPGNVRELHNLIERMAVLHPRGLVQVADLPQVYRRGIPAKSVEEADISAPNQFRERSIQTETNETLSEAMPSTDLTLLPPDGVDLKDHIANIELSLIKQALRQANGVVAHAAKLLNTRRTTLVEKLRKYDLQREDGAEEVSVDDSGHLEMA